MSKLHNPFFLFAAAFFAILQIFNIARAQDLDVGIKIDNGVVSVRGSHKTMNDPREKLVYFSTEYAGHDVPGGRITRLALADGSGQAVTYKQRGSAEYLADAVFTSWSYDVVPGIPKNGPAAAHVSWLTEDRGVLMLDDLLPKLFGKPGKVTAKIEFELPAGWSLSGGVRQIAANVFETADAENTVFFTGRGLRIKKGMNGTPDLVTSGEWLFTDREAANMVEEISAELRRLFGAPPFEGANIILSKFPTPQSHGTWEAETRGRSVLILSADMPFQTQSLQKLHEQMRHEIFHFWIPNSVNLSGNYDWFYEGFALYQALRMGVGSNRIRFEDMLDTLSRAYNIDAAQGQRSSLIEASSMRWAGANTQVYARGMIVAFLCDITMLQRSKGKNSISDVLGRVYSEHSMSKPRKDGNAAVIGILESYDYLRPVTERYVKGRENIAWKSELDAVGLEAIEENRTVRLKVKDDPGGRQKALLDKLGYNNWRKRSSNSK